MGRFTRVSTLAICVVLSGCGTASIQYGSPVNSTSDQAAVILAAVAKGAQTVALPNSRLLIVVTPATQGADQNTGAPSPTHTPTPTPPPEGPGHAPAAAPSHGGGGTPSPHPAPLTPTPSPTPAPTPAPAPAAKTTSTDGATSSNVTFTLTDNAGTKYAITVAQIESDLAFTAIASNDFFSENDFSITRLANTRIPTTVSNTFTDETASRVKSIASIATTIASAAAIGAEAPTHGAAPGAPPVKACLSADFVIDDPAIKVPPAGGLAHAPDLTKWTARKNEWVPAGQCLDIDIVAQPLKPNLVPVASLAPAFAATNGDWTKVWPVPACMTVQVTIKPKNDTDTNHVATGLLTLIDPDYVELMPIPKKGKIAMHPICGADFTDSATDKYQADFDTISAISAALPAKKAAQ